MEHQNYSQVRISLSTNRQAQNSSLAYNLTFAGEKELQIKTDSKLTKAAEHSVPTKSAPSGVKKHPYVRSSWRFKKTDKKAKGANAKNGQNQKLTNVKSSFQLKNSQGKNPKLLSTLKKAKTYRSENDISLVYTTKSGVTIHTSSDKYVKGDCFNDIPRKLNHTFCKAASSH